MTRRPPTSGLTPVSGLDETSPNGIPASQDLTDDARRALIYSVKCPPRSRGGCDAKAGKPCRAGFPCFARRWRAIERKLYKP